MELDFYVFLLVDCGGDTRVKLTRMNSWILLIRS